MTVSFSRRTLLHGVIQSVSQSVSQCVHQISAGDRHDQMTSRPPNRATRVLHWTVTPCQIRDPMTKRMAAFKNTTLKSGHSFRGACHLVTQNSLGPSSKRMLSVRTLVAFVRSKSRRMSAALSLRRRKFRHFRHSASTATRLWVGRPGFDSRQGLGIFLFATASRPTLRPSLAS